MAERRRRATGDQGQSGARARRATSSSGQSPASTGSGELQSSSEIRTALIAGNTFHSKAVQYSVVGELAMFEGDIVLGTVQQVEQTSAQLRAERSGALASGVAITGANFRWPNCRIPYTIDTTLPSQNRVTDAIAHWQSHTHYTFVVRGSEADFVTFRSSTGCSSSVGRQGGQQFVNLGSGCSTGNAIHEIGHTVGLWHEQSREDRDTFVTIHWNKIQAGFEHNFDQHISDGDDIGAYDYGSIMHYPRDAFSTDGTDTITPVTAGVTIGQRTALSAGDIAAAETICTPVVKRKEIVKDIAKDPITDTGKEIVHDTVKEQVKDIRLDTVKEQIADTVKEQIRDTLKEQIRDTIKEQITDTVKEQVRDTIKEGIFDPPFGKGARDPIGPLTPGLPGRQVPGLGGGALPFAMSMPHQAPAAASVPGGAGAGQEQAAQTIAQLDAQLQLLAEQLATVESTRAQIQSQYDETLAVLQSLVADQEQGLGF